MRQEPRRRTKIFSYRAFGLSIESDLALPELRLAEGEGTADVHVGVGPVEPLPAEARQVGAVLTHLGDEAQLTLENVGRFRVRGHGEITIDPNPEASEGDIRCHLLGSVFAILLHRRGRLPLHASAVVADGRAILFAGASGAGKSTTAAALHDRGYPMLCDDMCTIETRQREGAFAWPGVTGLKLWDRTLAYIGRSPLGLKPVVKSVDKFHVPVDRFADYRSYSVGAVYLLESADGSAGGIERLTGSAAVATLFSHTFRGQLTQELGTGPAHLQQCLELVRSSAIYRMRRNWGLDLLGGELDQLEAHLRRAAET